MVKNANLYAEEKQMAVRVQILSVLYDNQLSSLVYMSEEVMSNEISQSVQNHFNQIALRDHGKLLI